MLAVEARGLVKRFGETVAVDGIDLQIPVGGCFGFLGPNGAGKTTTIKMITCVSPPTAGELHVLDGDVRGDRRAIKARLGVGGMQRRLLIARALVNDPELLVLDEPTTGLDPQARHLVWERLRRLKRGGKTLLLTTHYMEEAAQLCDQIVVLDHGLVIARGTPAELVREHVAPRVVEVQGMEDGADDIVRIAGDLAQDVEAVGDRVLIYAADGEEIVSRIRGAGVPHQALILREATLEDVFLRLTGHALVDD
jgi:lipooligosaccharide transport system ATP-binding protein